MTADRWQQLVDRLEDEGKVEKRENVLLEDRPGSADEVTVTTPLGHMRLRWTTEPKRLGEKALYSKRGGSTVSVQAMYDESEEIHHFTVERLNHSGHWERLDAEHFSL